MDSKTSTILALLLISVKQRGGPKMRLHHVQQPGPAGYTLPRLPEVYRMPITDTSVFQTRGSGPFLFSQMKNLCYKQQLSVCLVTL